MKMWRSGSTSTGRWSTTASGRQPFCARSSSNITQVVRVQPSNLSRSPLSGTCLLRRSAGKEGGSLRGGQHWATRSTSLVLEGSWACRSVSPSNCQPNVNSTLESRWRRNHGTVLSLAPHTLPKWQRRSPIASNSSFPWSHLREFIMDLAWFGHVCSLFLVVCFCKVYPHASGWFWMTWAVLEELSLPGAKGMTPTRTKLLRRGVQEWSVSRFSSLQFRKSDIVFVYVNWGDIWKHLIYDLDWSRSFLFI